MDRTPELPEPVRESAQPQNRERDARLIRSQLEVIRDVMLAASVCGTWLTLGGVSTCQPKSYTAQRIEKLVRDAED